MVDYAKLNVSPPCGQQSAYKIIMNDIKSFVKVNGFEKSGTGDGSLPMSSRLECSAVRPHLVSAPLPEAMAERPKRKPGYKLVRLGCRKQPNVRGPGV